MVPTIHNLDYVPQGGGSNNYCGPASVKMVLSKIKPTTEELPDIFLDTNIDDKNWAHTTTPFSGSSPIGISSAIQHRVASATTSAKYRVNYIDDRESFTRHICNAIIEHKATPIVLVYGQLHWIVANGCEMSDPASSLFVPSNSVRYLFVLNPALDMFSLPANPLTNRLQEVVPHREWKRFYLMHPFESPADSDYFGQFVAIIDKDRVEFPGEGDPAANGDESEGDACNDCSPDFAESILENEPCFQGNDWEERRKHLAGLDAQPCDEMGYIHSRSSCLRAYVETDRAGHKSNRIVLIVRYGCQNGEFRGAVVSARGEMLASTTTAFYGKSLESARDAMNLNGIPVLLDRTTFTIFEPEGGQDLVHLSWAPSVETMSPYLPVFDKIRARRQNTDEVVDLWVRLDGQGFLNFQPMTGERQVRVLPGNSRPETSPRADP